MNIPHRLIRSVFSQFLGFWVFLQLSKKEKRKAAGDFIPLKKQGEEEQALYSDALSQTTRRPSTAGLASVRKVEVDVASHEVQG